MTMALTKTYFADLFKNASSTAIVGKCVMDKGVTKYYIKGTEDILNCTVQKTSDSTLSTEPDQIELASTESEHTVLHINVDRLLDYMVSKGVNPENINFLFVIIDQLNDYYGKNSSALTTPDYKPKKFGKEASLGLLYVVGSLALNRKLSNINSSYTNVCKVFEIKPINTSKAKKPQAIEAVRDEMSDFLKRLGALRTTDGSAPKDSDEYRTVTPADLTRVPTEMDLLGFGF